VEKTAYTIDSIYVADAVDGTRERTGTYEPIKAYKHTASLWM
jgi:hypothetical protein